MTARHESYCTESAMALGKSTEERDRGFELAGTAKKYQLSTVGLPIFIMETMELQDVM